jgi:hypothetical protein
MTSQPKPGGCAERCFPELEPGSMLVLKVQTPPALWRFACAEGVVPLRLPPRPSPRLGLPPPSPLVSHFPSAGRDPGTPREVSPRPAATFPRLEASCQHTSGTLPSRPAAESPPHPVVRRSAADGSVHSIFGQRVVPSDVSPEASGRTISPTGSSETNCSGSSCRPRASLRTVSA